MEIENHKEEVPFAHYEALFKDLNPREVLERLPEVGFDGGAFQVTLLGRSFSITYPGCEFSAKDGGALPPLPTRTFLLRYLLESKQVAFGGAWKTFREMPWGEMYIKPYTGRVLTRAAFKAAAEKRGAVPLKRGDAGYQFDLIGPYRMQSRVWEGDDEVPPNAQVRYSDKCAEGFAAEDRVVAGDIRICTVKRNFT